ncbi:MAG: hypothetical protein U1E36_03970 [Rickettsiales bacterium]
MRSRAPILSSFVVATSLTTLTLAGCGLYEKQPPRYNTVSGARHAPALNPSGEGLKEFPPREARAMYEYEQDNIRADREYPGTEEARTENEYPVEALGTSATPPPGMQPMSSQMPAPNSGSAEPSPLYYLEQQGMAPAGGMAPAQMSTQEAAPTTPIASAPMAPAQYEQQQTAMPAETLPEDANTFPHLGDVPAANQQIRQEAQNARNEANQAFAEQPAMLDANEEKRQQVNQAAADNSMMPPPPPVDESSEVVADFSADAVAPAPQQRRMLTSEEVDQAVQPNGVYDQNASPLAAPNSAEAELHSQLAQETMPPANAPALTAPQPPMMSAAPPPPPPYDVPPEQMQPPADMMPPPPPPQASAAPLRPLDNVYGGEPVRQPIYDPNTAQQPVEVQEYPTVAAQQPLVLTPPGGSQLNPPSGNLQRRAQYLQESRYARMRSAHRAAPRTY